MALFMFVPRVQQTITTTGTGGSFDLSGGVVSPTYMTFDAAGAIASPARNDSFQVIYSMDDGTNFEVGVGTFAQATKIVTRSQVIASSNANAAVNWGAGNKTFALINFASGLINTDATGAMDVINYPATSLGPRAVCIGSRAATGDSLAVGISQAGGNSAIAIKGVANGLWSLGVAGGIVQSDYSIAIGKGATTQSATGAVSVGQTSTASGNNAVAVGQSANATAAGAVAIGSLAASYASGGSAFGTYGYAWMSDCLAYGPGLADSGGVGAGGANLVLYLNKTTAIGTNGVLKLPTGNTSPTFESATGYNAFGVLYGRVIGHNATDYKVYDVVVAFHRVTGTVTLLGTPTITAGVASAGASSWTLTVVVNAGALDFTVNADASKWSANLAFAWSNS